MAQKLMLLFLHFPLLTVSKCCIREWKAPHLYLTTLINGISGFYLENYLANFHTSNDTLKMPNREHTAGVQNMLLIFLLILSEKSSFRTPCYSLNYSFCLFTVEILHIIWCKSLESSNTRCWFLSAIPKGKTKA